MTGLASSRKFFRRFFNDAPWQLWTAQLRWLIQSEVKRNFLKRRSIWIYLVAFARMVILLLMIFQATPKGAASIQDTTNLMAFLFQIYFLHMGIFIGCLGIFTWLFRGEIVEK